MPGKGRANPFATSLALQVSWEHQCDCSQFPLPDLQLFECHTRGTRRLSEQLWMWNFLCHLDNAFYEWQLRTQEGKRRGRKQQFKQRSDGGWRGGRKGWGRPSPVQICEWIQLLSRVLPYPWTWSPFRVPQVLTLLQTPTLRSSLALPSPVSLCLCPTPKHHLLHCIFRDSHKQ